MTLQSLACGKVQCSLTANPNPSPSPNPNPSPSPSPSPNPSQVRVLRKEPKGREVEDGDV